MKQLIALMIFFSAVTCYAQDTLHFMSYNLLNYYGSDADSATRNPYFRTVIGATHPDILATLEMRTDANSINFLNGVLKPINAQYARAPFVPGQDTNSSLYFLSDKYECIGNQPIHTLLRDINHYLIVQLQTLDTVHVFVVHLKASSGAAEEAQRLSEVDSIRLITDLLPAGTSFIVCGDFNFYKSTEPAYVRLLENTGTNEGYVADPITMTGTWNNAAYSQYHTQSPRTRSFGGGITGGLDDRFDLILFSHAINTNGPLQYVSGSTVAYGNDGNHFNDSINHLPNTAVSVAVANALHYAADHLPVIAKFVFVNGWANGVNGELISAIGITVFPNPAIGMFSVKLASCSSLLAPCSGTVEVLDLVGRIILFLPFEEEKAISLENISPGIYFVRVTSGESVSTTKLVVDVVPLR